jgi:hypothetical protein
VQVQIRESMKVHGYTERPISRTTEVIGAVAQCRVEFEMDHGAGRVYRAIDLFNCARPMADGGSCPSSVTFEIEPAETRSRVDFLDQMIDPDCNRRRQGV